MEPREQQAMKTLLQAGARPVDDEGNGTSNSTSAGNGHAPDPYANTWTDARPENAEDQEEEIIRRQEERMRKALQLSQGEDEGQPKPRLWPYGAPTPPEFLEGPRCKLTGRPLEEPARMAELPWAADARQKRNMERFKAWAGLNAQQKTQLVACLWWGKEDNPQWRVALPTEPSHPEVVIRAPDQEVAFARYKKLCGIKDFGRNEPAAARYEENGQ